MKYAIVEFDSDRSIAIVSEKEVKNRDDFHQGAKAVILWGKGKKECLSQVLSICQEKKDAENLMANYKKTRRAFLQQMDNVSDQPAGQPSTSRDEQVDGLKRKIRRLEDEAGKWLSHSFLV